MNKNYSFDIKRNVVIESENPIMYTLEISGDDSFIRRCLNISEKRNLQIGLRHKTGIFRRVKSGYDVGISSYIGVNSLPFLDFLKGKPFSFSSIEKAESFKEEAYEEVEYWLEQQWKEFVKLKKMIEN